MKYLYSTTYKDNPNIVYCDDVISNVEVLKLVEKFDWSTELQKKDEHFSPGLAFINIDDKHSFLVSGAGKGKLEKFQVTFILPKKKNIKLKKSQKEKFWRNWASYYKGCDYYEAVCSIKESTQLLNLYIDNNYSRIQSQIGSKIIDSEEYSIPLEYESDALTNFVDNNSWFMDHIVIRILGILLAAFFSVIAYSMLITSEGFNMALLIFGVLSIVFITGVIMHEVKLFRNMINK